MIDWPKSMEAQWGDVVKLATTRGQLMEERIISFGIITRACVRVLAIRHPWHPSVTVCAAAIGGGGHGWSQAHLRVRGHAPGGAVPRMSPRAHCTAMAPALEGVRRRGARCCARAFNRLRRSREWHLCSSRRTRAPCPRICKGPRRPRHVRPIRVAKVTWPPRAPTPAWSMRRRRWAENRTLDDAELALHRADPTGSSRLGYILDLRKVGHTKAEPIATYRAG
jgi:hypothetical protein